MEILVDALRPQDWESLRAIYEEGLATGLATFEVDAPGWHDWNNNHLPVCRLAARQSGKLVGWAALSPVSRRQAYSGVAEVSVYVAAAARGKGVGRELLSALIPASEQAGIWTLQSVIMAENEASLALHRSCGFREVGRRERISTRCGVWHDTVILERRSRVMGV